MDRESAKLKWIVWIFFVLLPLVVQFKMLETDTYQESREKIFNWQHASLSQSSESMPASPLADEEVSFKQKKNRPTHINGLLPAMQLSQEDKNHISSVYNRRISFLYGPITGSETDSDHIELHFFQAMQLDFFVADLDFESMQLAYDRFLGPISAVSTDYGNMNVLNPQAVPIELQFRKTVWAERTMLQYNQPSIEEKGYIVSGEDLRFLRYDAIINKVADRHSVDPALIKAIITVESYFNHKAESHRGAKGLMQLMPRTAEDLGVTDILDPEQNIDAGARYYKWLLKRVKGKRDLALAAYNAGIKRVMDYRGIPPFAETRAYVIKVQQYYKKYKEKPKRS